MGESLFSSPGEEAGAARNMSRMQFWTLEGEALSVASINPYSTSGARSLSLHAMPRALGSSRVAGIGGISAEERPQRYGPDECREGAGY